MSFYSFQLLLAGVMVAGLVIFLLPLWRLAKLTGLPSLSVLLLLVPVMNVAWLFWVATSCRLLVDLHKET